MTLTNTKRKTCFKGRGALDLQKNGVCKERGWKLQRKKNSRIGSKIRIGVNL